MLSSRTGEYAGSKLAGAGSPVRPRADRGDDTSERRVVSLPWLGGLTPGCMALSKNFSLGETFPPIPEKLVTKIQSEEYVELAELLPDNVEVLRKADTQPSAQGQGQRQLRRVSNLSTWVQCFTTYAAILAEAHPHRTRDLFAYLRLIVREAQRHKGDGWRAYDVLFRKLAATNRTLKWG